jgi:hypothetical protein
MLIGLDFDNTIVDYNELFYQVALELNLVPKTIKATKLSVRSYLREIGNEAAWTEMQGYVYGAKMSNAIIYEGLINFLVKMSDLGVKLVIVSHKTKNPLAGHPYDLHEAANIWIKENLTISSKQLVEDKNIFFEPTKEKKIQRIDRIGCDFFIDDLPEILESNLFPKKTGRILFDPDGSNGLSHHYTSYSNWSDIAQKFLNELR